MNGKMKCFVKGILLGLFGHPLKEPVAQEEPAELGEDEEKE